MWGSELGGGEWRGRSAEDSRVDRPSVSSPLGESEREAARRSRSSRRRFSFLPAWLLAF